MQGAQSRNRNLAAKEMFARIFQRDQIREIQVSVSRHFMTDSPPSLQRVDGVPEGAP